MWYFTIDSVNQKALSYLQFTNDCQGSTGYFQNVTKFYL